MAETQRRQLPCDAGGTCMLCEKVPADDDKLICNTCATPWHLSCLWFRPETLGFVLQWDCPDCVPAAGDVPAPPVVGVSSVSGASGTSGELIAAIRAIEADVSLSEQEKARKRQQLLSKSSPDLDDGKSKKNESNGEKDVLGILDESLNCSICMQLLERPVTTPCGHNFCLKCFQKWVGQGKRTCAKCRHTIPDKVASQPRINSVLVVAIRMAKLPILTDQRGPLKAYHFIHNQNRPDKAFTTERAKKPGKANACSGKIFVTVPPDHFGPILAENDPVRKQGVLVGESWEDRMECRQWGTHLPHVAGIAGQKEYGAQSVALSGGYEDDEDNGEWFLYTGSGGRDLSGNKRTNKLQSFDQEFTNMNAALRVSCKKGYPVRVVRSHKEARSSYAPETGVRYDGIYRIEKCWRKVGIQGKKVCRYLFVRCDNEPAPWTSDEHGDRPRSLPAIPELISVTEITERKESPHWDYDEEDGSWKWKKPPPRSRKERVATGNLGERKRIREAKRMNAQDRLLKEFSCLICRNVMTLPLTTPCGHNFCKPCLENAFTGQTFVRERTCQGRRTLRAQKNVMKCPSCSNDISDFLQNPQVNRDVMDVIGRLKTKSEEEASKNDEELSDDTDEKSNGVNESPDAAEGAQELKCTDEFGALTDVKEDLQAPGVGGNPKRRKADNAEDSIVSQDVGVRAEGRKAREVTDEGDNSPSSPLHVGSDGDDDFV
ncbi:E3 ubiquitin-protein ligase ORTHRUS 2-like [Macadamia integrifolia]|uniref:E3 ubiquitin-protein ligase ORTHRUS 2-like n=1 Tax=Macadamia integrifolia TaxID=60698 RepID=UPI001C4FD87D|nr:E3 ubiquitin-protein ligase ORTHRUS 2-like [Macadamia integrifolia]